MSVAKLCSVLSDGIIIAQSVVGDYKTAILTFKKAKPSIHNAGLFAAQLPHTQLTKYTGAALAFFL